MFKKRSSSVYKKISHLFERNETGVRSTERELRHLEVLVAFDQNARDYLFF